MPTIAQLLAAAERADFRQVVRDSACTVRYEPPCFHLREDSGTFCLRTRADHGEGSPHAFVSLRDLLASGASDNPLTIDRYEIDADGDLVGEDAGEWVRWADVWRPLAELVGLRSLIARTRDLLAELLPLADDYALPELAKIRMLQLRHAERRVARYEEDAAWRCQWQTRLSRGQGEAEGAFYERLEHDASMQINQLLLRSAEESAELRETLAKTTSERNALKTRLAEVETAHRALRDWRVCVTSALQRPGGARFEDVPQIVRDLVADLREAQAKRDATDSVHALREALAACRAALDGLERQSIGSN